MSDSSSSTSSASSTAVSALQLVLHNLSGALVYSEPTNVDTNKKLWNEYARTWRAEAEGAAAAAASAPQQTPQSQAQCAAWVEAMARQVGRSPSELHHVGDEWSDEFSLSDSLSRFLFPLLSPSSRVAEIGVGGGRVAARVAPRVAHLACFDISDAMLAEAETALSGHSNLSFHLLGSSASFPPSLHHSFHCVYAFDVLPHVDLHAMRDYFRSLHSLLLPSEDSRVFLSTANIATPLGWERFSRQRRYTAGGFYFITPETVRVLAEHTGWQLLQTSEPDASSSNLYLNRDFLFVMRPKRPKTAQ